MKWLKRILLVLLTVFTALLLSVGGTVYWAIKNPSAAWQIAEKKYFPKDLNVTWSAMAFEGLRTTGLNVTLDWSTENLKIKKESPSINFKLDKVNLRISLFPFGNGPKAIVHELRAISTDPIILRLSESAEPEVEKSPFQMVTDLLELGQRLFGWVELEVVAVDISEVRVSTGEAKPTALTLKASQASKADHLNVSTGISLPSKDPLNISLDAELWSKHFDTDDPINKSVIKFKSEALTGDLKADISYKDETALINLSGKINYATGKSNYRVSPVAKIKLNDSEADVEVRSDIDGIPGSLGRINNLIAKLKVPLEDNQSWSEEPATISVLAPVELFFIDKNMRQPIEESCQCKIPEVLEVKVEGKAWLAALTSEPKKKQNALDVRVSVESVKNKLLEVDLRGDLKADKEGKEFTFHPQLNSEVVIHSYQGIRKFLDARGVLIPAPFNVLEGKVSLVARGPVNTVDSKYVIPAVMTADLSSTRQKIDLKLEVTTNVDTKFKGADIDVSAKIADLQIELPPLDPLKGKPRVVADKRILKSPEDRTPKESKFKLTLSVQAETTKPSAIRLLSPYFKPYLPISLKVVRSDEKDNSGFIRTAPFDIVYLRRKMTVEKMVLDLSRSEVGVIPVDGRIRVEQTQYTVFIDIKGPSTKPSVILSSDPYLPEADIVSVLLYDKVTDQSGETETAGSVQAAMADRAIGLFGLWAFAATPIKSFSYNPATKVYTATVAISKDASVGIGTNWEEATHLELRKRVSRRWVLTAAWTPATQEEEERTTLVLQWEKRF